MARLTFFLATLLAFSMGATAQRITRQYRNMPFSAALKDLNNAQQQYAINFVYNELEDFKVTKSIRNASVPDAIRQLIGFYPIKMTQIDHVLVVECTQKASSKMTGRIVDAQRRPVDVANVALLSVRDSSLITGGVTNEDGLFVIPCEAERVIVKVSSVGYQTAYRTCRTGNIGTLTLAESTVRLNDVLVKAMRHNLKMGKEGLLVNVQGTELSNIGTATDVLGEMPRVNIGADGSVNVFAKGQPLIYVNNRKVADLQELKRIKSDNIKSVEVITSPGSQYDASVQSVIRIKTIGKQGEGWSGEGFVTASYNKWWGTSQQWSSTYRSNRTEVSGTVWGLTQPSGENNRLTNDIDGTQHVFINQYSPLTYRSKYAGAESRLSYSFDNDNEAGLSYSLQYTATGKGHMMGNSWQEIYENGQLADRFDETADVYDRYSPQHDVNAYFVGKVGKIGVDFNATYLWKKSGRNMLIEENGNRMDSRTVHTQNRQHSRMAAGKLMLSYPVWRGTVNMGAEVTASQIRGTYANAEQYVDAADTKILESNTAGFTEYAVPLANFSFRAGVRYEHVKTDYYAFGQWEKAPSRRYSDWFPMASVAWNKDRWNISLAYTRKTRRPSYNSLRSEVQYDNRYTYEGGNPYLRASVINNFDLNLVYGWLSVNAGYNYSDNPIIWVSTLYNDQDIAFLRNVNFRHQQDFYASVVAEPRFGWYNPMLEIDCTQSFLCTDGYDIALPANRPSFCFRLNNRFNISPTLKAFLNLKYRTANHNGLQVAQPYGRIDVKFVQSLCRRSLDIILFANDLLHTDKEKWRMYGSHVTMTKDCYGYVRCVGLSLSYHFNATQSKYKGSGAGNSERNRLN